MSGGGLRGQDLELLDRRLAEQFAGLLAESGRDGAGQVRVATGVIGDTPKIPHRAVITKTSTSITVRGRHERLDQFPVAIRKHPHPRHACLLYTSDAADE